MTLYLILQVILFGNDFSIYIYRCYCLVRKDKKKKSSKFDKFFLPKKVSVEKDIILCTVDNDCQIKSDKPFFLYSKKNAKKYDSYENLPLPNDIIKETKEEQGIIKNNTEYEDKIKEIKEAEDEEISPITVRDIKDLNAAVKYVT